MTEKQVVVSSRVILRNDTAENWNSINPVLLKGEAGFDSTNQGIKLGDGVNSWKKLNFVSNNIHYSKNNPSEPVFEGEHFVPSVGAIWINNTNTPPTIFICVPKASIINKKELIWVRLVSEKESEGFGDMKLSIFAKGEAAKDGYVDKATVARGLESVSTLKIKGDVLGSGNFDGVEFYDAEGGKEILLTLATTGVPTGTYPKVTVNAKGLVIKGESLAASDIPSIPNTKVTGLGTAAKLNTGTSSGNVPVLDSSGKLSESILPALAITEVFEADSVAKMLELTAQLGDVCIRTDINRSVILGGDGKANVVTNWKELRTPTDLVQSVCGKKGVVNLDTSDVSEITGSLYFTEERVEDVLKNRILILDGGNA